MISPELFDRLVEQGRRHGGLKTDDIQQVLPVESMTSEELVDMLTRLEAADIAVEIDPALLHPRRQQITPQPTKPGAPASPQGVPLATGHPRLSELGSSIRSVRGSARHAPEPAGIYGKLPGTVLFWVAALMLIVLTLAVWHFA